jgi:hypothetical protein
MRATSVTLDELKDWPPLVSVTQAGRALGIGASASYDHVRIGSFPVPLVRVGSRNRVRTVDLLRFLAD